MITTPKHLRIFLTLTAATAVVLMAFSACSSADEDDDFAVSLALSGSPSTLDPQGTTETLTFQVDKSLYDTLIEPKEDGTLVPALAESWESSDDNLSITFHLRTDVVFHDGTSFDAWDVKASLDRIRSPEFASPNAPEFEAIEEVQVLDDFTVRLILNRPSAPLLYSLASGWGAMLSAEALEAGWDYASKPLGTGPYRFSEWRPDEYIELEKFDNYWGSAGPDRVTFRIIPESSVQIQALLSGQVDILYLVDQEDVPLIEAKGDISVDELDSALVLVIAINTSRDILSDVNMRRALNFAIDKQTALDVAYGGGTVVGSFNDVTSAYYVDFSDRYPYDPDRAAELAAQAGYDGQTLDLVLPQNFAPHIKAGELYQEMLRQAGIDAQIRMVDWPTWISEVYGEANYDLTVIGHTGKLDPDGRFIGYGSGDMYVRFANERLAELIDLGRQTLDVSQRREIYREVQEIFSDQAPFVYVGSPVRRIAYNSAIRGFIMMPNLDTFDFRGVRPSGRE